jgi:hypothetical protein
MLCKYKNIFGEPRKGVHKYRVFDIAVVDVLGTVGAAWLISWASGVRFISVLVALLGLGVLLHRMFCVNTKVNVMLFGRV